jgi:hypothetical protein
MRTGLMLAAAGLAIVTASAQPSSAEVTYAWCAVSAENDAVRNCGFATYEQCRAAISGNGGFCEPNPMYQPGAAPKSRRPVR